MKLNRIEMFIFGCIMGILIMATFMNIQNAIEKKEQNKTKYEVLYK